jgi:hypothetical protein
MDTQHLDPMGKDYKARKERADCIQKEQSNEAWAGEWIRADIIEPILVDLAGVAQGILAGIPDAARSHGAAPALVADIEATIRDAQSQIAQALDGIASAASQRVDAIETELEDAAASLPVSGPKERKAGLRKPRGPGKMGRK